MYDVLLGNHIVCTATTKEAADMIKATLAKCSGELFQAGPCTTKKVYRDVPAPKKKKAAK